MKTIDVCGTTVSEEDIEKIESPVLKSALKVRFAALDGAPTMEMSGCTCIPLMPGSNHPNYRAYRVRRTSR